MKLLTNARLLWLLVALQALALLWLATSLSRTRAEADCLRTWMASGADDPPSIACTDRRKLVT